MNYPLEKMERTFGLLLKITCGCSFVSQISLAGYSAKIVLLFNLLGPPAFPLFDFTLEVYQC